MRLISCSTTHNDVIVRSSCRDSFRCGDHPAPSLRTLTNNAGIICVNSFSHLLLPSVHVDFVILARRLTTLCGRGVCGFDRATDGARRVTLYKFVHSNCLTSRAEGAEHFCATGTGGLGGLLRGRFYSSNADVRVDRGSLRVVVHAGFTNGGSIFRGGKVSVFVRGARGRFVALILGPTSVPRGRLRGTIGTLGGTVVF